MIWAPPKIGTLNLLLMLINTGIEIQPSYFHLFFSQCHLNNQWVKANPDVSESNISDKICNWFNDLKLDLKRQMWNDQKVLRPMVYIESFCTENQLQAPTFLNRHTTNVIAICCGTKFLKYVYLNIKFPSIVWARV